MKQIKLWALVATLALYMVGFGLAAGYRVVVTLPTVLGWVVAALLVLGPSIVLGMILYHMFVTQKQDDGDGKR